MAQMTRDQKSPRYTIVDRWSGSNLPTSYNIVCQRNRFHLKVSEATLKEDGIEEPSIHQAHYKRLHHAIVNHNDTEIQDLHPNVDPDTVMSQWAIAPLLPLFEKLPVISEASAGLQTLFEYNNMPTFRFKLTSVMGKLTLADDPPQKWPLTPMVRPIRLSPPLPLENVPTVSQREVWLPFDSKTGGVAYPHKLIVASGELMWFKSWVSGPSARREIGILNRILQLSLHEKFPLPRLHACVTYEEMDTSEQQDKNSKDDSVPLEEDEGSQEDDDDYAEEEVISGFLTHIIGYRSSLQSPSAQKAPLEQRQTWYKVIVDTVTALHEVGIIWGDVKPDNIMIDRDNKAWVIDFGGGYTEGWVDEDKQQTVEGDLQGLQRIRAHLGLEAA
jgi:hypothetical protein